MTTDPPTLEQLLADFPLPAVYRHGGPHLLLRWTDPDRQGQLMLQPVRAGGERDARRVLLAGARLSLSADARPRSLVLSRIDVVAPPPSLRVALARRLLAEEARAFWWTAQAEVQIACEESGRPRPSWLVPCPACEGSEPREEAPLCGRCLGHGWTLAGDEDAGLARYLALRTRWLAVGDDRLARSGARPRAPERPSSAPEAAEGEALWAAFAEHRPHGRGTYVAPMTEASPKPLLLFRPGPDLDPAEFAGVLAARREQARLEADRCQHAHEARMKAEAQRRVAEYLALLGE